MEKAAEQTETKRKGRPLLLSALCIFSFVYNSFILIILIFALFIPEFVTESFTRYTVNYNFTVTETVMLLILGILIVGSILTGVYLFWKGRIIAVYFYFPAKILYTLLILFTGNYTYYNVSVSVFLLLSYLFFVKSLIKPVN